MSYNYCPGCGTKLDLEETVEHESETQTELVTDSAVEIARIEANRDVSIAKINAGITEHAIEVEQVAEQAHAEGKAEGLELALAPEQPTEPPVVVVDAPDAAPAGNDAPAPPEPSESHTEPPEHHKRSGYGNPMFFGG